MGQAKGQRVIIIETRSANGVGWAVSFDGYNPTDEKCFQCENEKQAVKLQNLINKL